SRHSRVRPALAAPGWALPSPTNWFARTAAKCVLSMAPLGRLFGSAFPTARSISRRAANAPPPDEAGTTPPQAVFVRTRAFPKQGCGHGVGAGDGTGTCDRGPRSRARANGGRRLRSPHLREKFCALSKARRRVRQRRHRAALLRAPA